MKNSLSAVTLVFFAGNAICKFAEKLYHLFLWTHPAKTRYFLFICLLLTLFSMIVPMKIVFAVLGLCFLFPVWFLFIQSNFLQVEKDFFHAIYLCNHQFPKQSSRRWSSLCCNHWFILVISSIYDLLQTTQIQLMASNICSTAGIAEISRKC